MLSRPNDRQTAIRNIDTWFTLAHWTLSLDLQANGSQPVFVQIARAIADSIRTGRLAPGVRLPGTRELAVQLGLNRNTVTAAFHELQAEGWVLSKQGQGTSVSRELPKKAFFNDISTALGRCTTP